MENDKRINIPASGKMGAACGAPTKNGKLSHSGAKADDILKDVLFHVERDQVLAIVGENRAGKSTIVKLLTRLYDPDEGSVLPGSAMCGDYCRNI